jgi:hypothetical protein
LSKTALDKSHNFVPGDLVEVCQGELIHLTGVIIGIDGDKIRMMPNHEELKVYYHIFKQFSIMFKPRINIIYHVHRLPLRTLIAL